MRLPANHSDSTASIAAQLYGARHDAMAVPRVWVRRLDVLQDTLQVCQRFLAAQTLDNSVSNDGKHE